jgi:hypothetical protein
MSGGGNGLSGGISTMFDDMNYKQYTSPGMEKLGGLGNGVNGSFDVTGLANALPGGGNDNLNGGIGSVLKGLFGNPNFLTKIAGGMLDGYNSKKNNKALAKATAQAAQTAQTPYDPFAQERPQYQEQLSQLVQNPYADAMVKSQVDNLQREQNIKDAAAGRRSNSLSSAPGVLAEQAKIAQQYVQQLGQLAGANIQPSFAGANTAAQILANGAPNTAGEGDTSGMLAPILYALSSANDPKAKQGDNSSSAMSQILGALFK